MSSSSSTEIMVLTVTHLDTRHKPSVSDSPVLVVRYAEAIYRLALTLLLGAASANLAACTSTPDGILDRVERVTDEFAGLELSEFETDVFADGEVTQSALYVQRRGALRHELTVTKALRSGRTSRTPASRLPSRDVRPWLAGARLTDRPAEAADRAVPGHWEGDLVVGPGNLGLLTLVERATRFALIGQLPGTRDSETVIDVLQHQITQLPRWLRQTLTWYQGQEMARHRDFTITTGCPVFFCDPHSPWQRGSNENLNGLIRDYHPKGTDFNAVTDAEIEAMVAQLNDRPRKTLEFHTPREKLDQLISSVALAP